VREMKRELCGALWHMKEVLSGGGTKF
jgi:hypothetical protein